MVMVDITFDICFWGRNGCNAHVAISFDMFSMKFVTLSLRKRLQLSELDLFAGVLQVLIDLLPSDNYGCSPWVSPDPDLDPVPTGFRGI
jgi:hypothetical protein